MPEQHSGLNGGCARVRTSGGTWLGMGEASDIVLRSTKVILPQWASTLMKKKCSAAEEVPRGPHVVSIGTFDGVHLGHEYLP